ncbi:MAG: DUF502 domain-containing protein [Pirellulales bacterium]
MEPLQLNPVSAARPARPFRTAVLRGLGGFLAPLLTIVILLWVWQTLKYYILQPVETASRNFIAWQIADIKPDIPPDAVPHPEQPNVFTIDGEEYYRLEVDELIPREVYNTVVRRSDEVPIWGRDFYRRFVELEYLRPWIVVPLFLMLFLGLMYLLGSLFAVGFGRVFWSLFEESLGRLPIVRAVYAPVKQVTDYMFGQDEPEFHRVVAVEYPRRGVWTIAFVTGDGLTDVQKITGEPMLTVLFPTSPTPIAGNTKIVARRETIDLPMTIDQAFQFILSFGVVVPDSQIQQARLLSAATSENGATSQPSAVTSNVIVTQTTRGSTPNAEL